MDTFPNIAKGKTPSEQAWMQISALFTTLAIAIVGGLLSGLIASRFGKLEKYFDDTEHFHECEPAGLEEKKNENDGTEMAEMAPVKGNSID